MRRTTAPLPKPQRSAVVWRETPSGSVTAVPVDEPGDGGPTRATPVPQRRSAVPADRRSGAGPTPPARDGGGAGPVADPGAVDAPADDAREELPPPPSPKSAFRQRYGVVYNTQGPRLRLGVLWALAVIIVLALRPLRPYGLAVLYAVTAGLAAMQVVDAWHEVRSGADRWVAALGASTLPVVATLGVRPLGGALLVLVVAAVVAAVVRQDRDLPVLAGAGHTVLAAGLLGGASAALVLLGDYEIGALIILLTYVMVYDASDYVVGSGATNGVEGPLAGGLFIAAATMLFAVTEVPPFRGVDIWSFAVLAVVACPAGQLLASAMLPAANAPAPAVRRLDSLLLVAPAWAGLVGLYLQRAAG